MGESISSKSPFLFFLEADLARSSAARATNSFQISLSEGLPVTAGPLNYFNKNHVLVSILCAKIQILWHTFAKLAKNSNIW